MNQGDPVSQMKIIHGALFLGVVLFVGICIYIHIGMGLSESFAILPPEALYLVILIGGTMIFGGAVIYKKLVGGIGNELSLEDKITKYRGAAILRVAFIESAALLIGIGYMLSGDFWYLALMIVPLFYFWRTSPSLEKLDKELRLTYTEQQKLSEL